MECTKLYIDGEWRRRDDARARDIVNPSTGEVISRVTQGTVEETNRAIQAARSAFDAGTWSRLAVTERADVLFALARAMRESSDVLARIETLNTGKTLAESQSDVQHSIRTFEYYGRLLSTHGGSVNSTAEHVLSITIHEPVGVCGLITPWNYPLLQASWKIAPALAAGNTVVIKPASLTPLTTLKLAELVDSIGLPPGVFNVVTGSAEVGETLAASHDVDLISLTGSNTAGASVMRSAASNFKRISLELGGKNPHIVFADADQACAIDYVLNGAFFNAGQMCSAGSRLLVERTIHEAFVTELAGRINGIRVGDGLSDNTQMGPVISAQQRQNVLDLIAGARDEGARVICGGGVPSGSQFSSGYWLQPTLITDVTADMRIAREEIFGPVVTIEKFDSEDQAVALANDTEFGLTAGFWTSDFPKANRVLRKLRAATVWVNDYNVTLAHAPWGGYKASGIGRELSPAGLEEYTEAKHAYINFEPKPMGWF